MLQGWCAAAGRRIDHRAYRIGKHLEFSNRTHISCCEAIHHAAQQSCFGGHRTSGISATEAHTNGIELRRRDGCARSAAAIGQGQNSIHGGDEILHLRRTVRG